MVDPESPRKLGRALAAMVLAFCIPVASAAEPGADGKEDAEYRAAIQDGLAEYDARHFEEARILFRRAHQIGPNARTLRGIGMASFELRDYVAAVRALSAALIETRKPLSLEQRTHAQGLLERSRLFIDEYTLKVSPPDARVLIDGRAPEPEPDGDVLLGFGTHTVEASRAGYAQRSFPISVRGGDHKDLVITLERKQQLVARPASADAMSGSAKPAPAFPGPTAKSGSSTGWLLAAGVAGLLGVGAGTYWAFESDQLSSCRSPPDGLRCDNRQAIETKRNLGMAGTAVAGATAVTLAVIGMLSGPKAAPKASAHNALSCAVGPSAILCATSF
jgi:hypothetical protein